jgi:hypothetical protein
MSGPLLQCNTGKGEMARDGWISPSEQICLSEPYYSKFSAVRSLVGSISNNAAISSSRLKPFH